MKRLLISSLAALSFAVPMISAPVAAADPPYWNRDRDYDGNRDHYRRDRHDGRRWDHRHHNGYMYRGRWYYGPPPAAYYGRYDFEPGYHSWRRGDRLPYYYRSHYDVVDYRYYHLRPPPRGCHYVRDDRGEILLVAIATGVILSAILNDY